MSGPNANTPAESLSEPAKPKRRKVWRCVLGVIVFLFVAIQFLPYGRNHTNPQTTATIAWDSKAAENLVRGACFDCHSNETQWTWYTHVAPVSWLVQRDVDHGREELNFSEGKLDEIGEAAELIQDGEMPPWFYRPLHAEARLSPSEKEALIQGLAATFVNSAPRPGDKDDDKDDDKDHDD